MNFFKKISETVIDTASTIGSKSVDLVETGKLKLQRNQLEAAIEDRKTAIGDLVYLAHLQNSTPNMDNLSTILSEIIDLENQIGLVNEKLRKETAQTTPSERSSEAPVQVEQTLNSGDETFCPQCGHKLSN